MAPSAVFQKSSGEPLVVNGSSERQVWLPKDNLLRNSRQRSLFAPNPAAPPDERAP